jgi:protein arginine kinase
MLRIDDGAEWLRGVGPDSDVVVSSRVRLARNFAGLPFPGRANRVEHLHILETAESRILGAGLADDMRWIDLDTLSPLECSFLVERHLISKQLAKSDNPRAVAVSRPDERLSIMVNEEDHLRIQVIRAGLALGDAFAQIDRVDDLIERGASYAFSPRFGYLTACPTNVGTGVRFSVMLHLPALRLTGDLEKVQRAAKAMSLAIRGYYGEGSEASGDLYQLSNQTTLGKTEDGALEHFETAVMPRMIEFERLARRALLDRRRVHLEDQIHRALGALRSARLLKADEAMQMLSLVRLGVFLRVLDTPSHDTLGRLMLLCQPGHLQQRLGKELTQSQRRIERASLVRSMIDRPART